jgi:hypothetical protein
MTQNSINSKNPVVQYIKTSLTSTLLINAGWAKDNTKPQKTEGVEVYTVTITPTNANNILVIKANAWGSCTNAVWVTLALFQDAGADALNTAVGGFVSTVGWPISAELMYSQVAGTTSATTFKVRAGIDTANWYINGYTAGLNFFGGTSNSYLEIMEIKA